MSDTQDRRRLQDALNTTLSGLHGDPWLSQRVLANAKGERKMKKRISVGLIWIIALVLAAATALAAALLTPRQLTEQVAVPMAVKNDGARYTREETLLLLRLAQENQIELSQNSLDQIERALALSEGYFKEELLMAIAKAEFGEAPQAWTLEQQKWFDDVCVAIGFLPMPEKAMPEGGEDAKLAIIKAANAHIHKNHDAGAPLDDVSRYRVGVQYIDGSADGEYDGLYWSIDYKPLHPEESEYWVYLRDDGTVLGDVVMAGIHANSTVNDIRASYRRAFGSDFEWSQSTLRAFREAVLKATDTGNRAYLCLARTTYPDIPQGAISKEQAHSIAALHVGFDAQSSTSHIFLIGDAPNPVWKVTIVQDPVQWFVEIDCMTGQIKATQLRDTLNQGWWKRMSPCAVTEDVDRTWVDDAPSVG